ncbi:MAG: hypothetical protein KF871_00085 [Hydrogenophaga sp.]|uniref:hypothetical protein n=1 Tax=Hydrogenophaga sp. TaxID=1904254 RepID=UPI001D8C22F8|nr:hypothetical protein [Hydrogenophaga sp.]MBX3608262.1 hypothetical protein [Hydrogenophaga sp.]
MPSPHPLLSFVLALPLLAACSPTFNWRSVPVDGTPLEALMPCKPDAGEREVPLGGLPTRLQMRSCETGGLTFALAWADVGDAVRVPPSLSGWRRASLAGVRVDVARVDEPAVQWVVQVPGAEQSLGLQVTGVDPQGGSVDMRAVHFTHGSVVFQAAVYGQRMDAAALAAFVDGLRLP